MTVSVTTIDISSFTTDAKFRTWGSATSTSLSGAGLTQTSDTGQINWSTVTKPTATNTKAGYEIWRFNDSLQSTKPIYFRLDYGSTGTASGNAPGTWLTVGTGTDGAGTITGVGMVVTQGQSNSVTSSNTLCMVGSSYSTSAGACTIVAGLALSNSSVHGGLWVIARTCSSSNGTTDGNGVSVLNSTSGSAHTNAFAQYSVPTNYAAFSGAATTPLRNASYASGNVLPLTKAYALIPGAYPHQGFVGYYNGGSDIPALSTFAASPWGASHTYLALGSSYSTNFTGIQSGSYSAAVLWE